MLAVLFLLTPNSSFQLNDILYVLSLTKSLLSVQKFTFDNDIFFEFNSNNFHVKDCKSGKIFLLGPSEHGLYTLSNTRFPDNKSHSAFLLTKASYSCQHSRLGYLYSRVLQ